jgi:hypothetical protein
MWRLPRISDYSYPRVTMIWIDVHTTEKTWSTRHTLSTLDPHMSLDHMYLTWSAYNNLSLVINKVGRMHYSREKSVSNSTSKPDWVAHGTHLSFSPNTIIKAVRLSQTSVCNQYVQYLLAKVNPSVLNRHRRELQSWRCQLATPYSLTFPTDDPPLFT